MSSFCYICPMSEKLNDTEFEISKPTEEDAALIGPMHVQSWLESYLKLDEGITVEVLKDLVSFVDTDEGTQFRNNVFKEQAAKPDEVLYRVVKDKNGKVVSFMHGKKEDDKNILDGIYLLNEVKGEGVAHRLVEEFLGWIDKEKPTYLEVISYNERAISFYKKYGFEITDKAVPDFKDKLPVLEMVRRER